MPKFTECRKCQCWMEWKDEFVLAVESPPDEDCAKAECHRHAPRVSQLATSQQGDARMWPETVEYDGCFEGIPREVGPRHVDPPDPLDDVLSNTDLGGHGRIASGLRSGLHTRICDALASENIDTVRDLIAWRAAKLIQIRNFGKTCLNATVEFLARRDLALKE